MKAASHKVNKKMSTFGYNFFFNLFFKHFFITIFHHYDRTLVKLTLKKFSTRKQLNIDGLGLKTLSAQMFTCFLKHFLASYLRLKKMMGRWHYV